MKHKKEERKIDLIEVKRGKTTYIFNTHEDYIEWLEKQTPIPTEKIPIPLETVNMTQVITVCKQHVKKIFEEGFGLKDIEHWIYEETMNAIYGESIWDWLNKHNKG